MNITDPLDRVFYSCLKEIELSYGGLSKSLRIRIERWIEKLSMTGKNAIWKKHRNAYAKLLLNMVFAKQLGEPFHMPPPDGSLPPFPTHLIAATMQKNLLGPHESTFWRSLFKRIGPDGDMEAEKGLEAFPVKSFFEKSILSSSAINSSYSQDINNHGNWSSSSSIIDFSGAVGGGGGGSSAHSFAVEAMANSMTSGPPRNIQNLKMLIKEQQHRIELLEEQLRHERIKYESEIHQLRYSHKLELERMRGISTPLTSYLATGHNGDSASGAPFSSVFRSSENYTTNPNNSHNTSQQSSRKPSSYFATDDRFDVADSAHKSAINNSSYNTDFSINNSSKYSKTRFDDNIDTDPLRSRNNSISSNNSGSNNNNNNSISSNIGRSNSTSNHVSSADFMEYVERFQKDLRSLSSRASTNAI